MRRTRQPEQTRRRGTVLFAVLFLIVIAALSASTLLTASAAERAAAARSLDELELRAAVRSALAVATADLATQRDAMLRGEPPEPPATVRIDRGDGQPGIVVEFIEQAGGSRLLPEAARLDLNLSSERSLAAIPGLGDSLAAAIASRRASEPFRSPAEAFAIESSQGNRAGSDLGVAGSPAGTSLTGADEPMPGQGSDPDSTPPSGPAGADLVSPEAPSQDPFTQDPFTQDPFAEEAGPAAWLDSVTVYGAEPQTMIGLGSVPDSGDAAGTPRINVNAPWSDLLEQAIIEATGDVTPETLRTLFIDAPRLTKPSELVALLVDKAVPTDQWPALLDAITTTPAAYRIGLVDINTAGVGVLAALPGVGAAAARDIADARERMDATDRLSITWPLDEGILSQSGFLACVDLVTTRCFQWRLTVRARFEPEEEGIAGFDPDDTLPSLLPDADEFGVAIREDGAPTGPAIVFEAVVDLAAARSRIAYLRERSAYDFAVSVASLPGFAGGDSGDESADEFGLTEFDDEPIDDSDPGPYRGPSLLGEDGPPLDDRDSGLDLGFDDGPSGSEPESDDIDPDGALRSRSGGSTPAGSDDGTGKDNRLGRWAPQRTRGDES